MAYSVIFLGRPFKAWICGVVCFWRSFFFVSLRFWLFCLFFVVGKILKYFWNRFLYGLGLWFLVWFRLL